jgi:maltose alpha-D-glucosyltransferase/alpha-amylase
LIDELRQARWFGGKSREIRHATVVDRAADGSIRLSLVRVDYVDGLSETYVLADEFAQPEVARAWLRSFAGVEVQAESGARVRFSPTHVLRSVAPERTEPAVPMTAEQSNTSVRYGDALMLKLFRRLQYGPNPDVEIGRFLTESSEFRGTPRVAGSVEYVTPDGQSASLAMLQEFHANRGDAWRTTLERLSRVLDGGDPAESVAAMARLGTTTAELHVALASGDEADFVAEPIDTQDITAWRAAILDEVQSAVDGLRRRGIEVDAQQLAERAEGIDTLLGSMKTRHHGDYHLGQVLESADGAFMIIDFEGEPAKPLAVRREKRSPLRDVAGMLRSFDYARHAALRAGDAHDEQRVARASEWYESVRTAFLHAYMSTVTPAVPGLLPLDARPALDALELEKAAYEVLYELNNRPDWLPIPLTALQARV